MTISGGRFDTITNNRFLDNGAWGIALVPYPEGNTTSDGRTCTGTKGVVATSLGVSGLSCLYDPWGVAVENNQFAGNGSFGNPSNADFANLLASGNEPVNCFSGNTEWDSTFTHQLGAATSGNALDGHPEQTPAACGTKTPRTGLLGVNTDLTLLAPTRMRRWAPERLELCFSPLPSGDDRRHASAADVAVDAQPL